MLFTILAFLNGNKEKMNECLTPYLSNNKKRNISRSRVILRFIYETFTELFTKKKFNYLIQSSFLMAIKRDSFGDVNRVNVIFE